MKNMTCIIVDDEKWARDMLELYVQKTSNLQFIQSCKNTGEAAALLSSHEVDLIFLDIQMPGQTGVEFLQQLPHPPMVIFTTAYSDYALKGFELEVIDYLLKPISFERFQQATRKAFDFFHKEKKAKAFDEIQFYEDQHIWIRDGHDNHKFFLKDILYIEGKREYVQYHTSDGRFMELKAMKDLEAFLPKTHFIRIHRSYIVARTQVKGQVKNNLLLKNDTLLPIGKTYKQRVLKKLF